jgi:hypothetical protein
LLFEGKIMTTFTTIFRASLAAVLLFTGSISIIDSALAFTGGNGEFFGLEGPRTIRITGKVFCTDCDVNAVRKAQPSEPRLYQLVYHEGKMVMQVEWISNPLRWNRVVWPARIWLRGSTELLHKLAAGENQQKEVEIVGFLSNSRTFDIAEVTIKG